jgi:hypothetical protein
MKLSRPLVSLAALWKNIRETKGEKAEAERARTSSNRMKVGPQRTEKLTMPRDHGEDLGREITKNDCKFQVRWMEIKTIII